MTEAILPTTDRLAVLACCRNSLRELAGRGGARLVDCGRRQRNREKGAARGQRAAPVLSSRNRPGVLVRCWGNEWRCVRVTPSPTAALARRRWLRDQSRSRL